MNTRELGLHHGHEGIACVVETCRKDYLVGTELTEGWPRWEDVDDLEDTGLGVFGGCKIPS